MALAERDTIYGAETTPRINNSKAAGAGMGIFVLGHSITLSGGLND